MANKKETSPEDKTETKPKSAASKAKKAPKEGAVLAKSTASAQSGASAKSAASDSPAAKKAKGTPGAKRRPLIKGTYFAKWEEVVPDWKVVDAKGQTLGRLASHIAMLLMGKNKPKYTAHSDTGDFVIVINAAEVRLTGNKWDDKLYKYHTNYPGGLKVTNARDLRAKHPDRIIERAVWGMLPKGHMGHRWIKKLRIFAGAEHTHQAQKPQMVQLPDLGMWKEA